MNVEAAKNIELRFPVAGVEQRLVSLNLGLVIFLPMPFREQVAEVRELFQQYLSLVPPATFKWQNLTGTSKGYKAVAKTAFSTIEAWLSLAKPYGSSCTVWLKDGDAVTDAGDHLLRLFGRDQAERPGDSNFLQILWPASPVQGSSHETLLAGAQALLSKLHFHSAYLGYTLGVSTLANVAGYSRPIATHVYATARRFRGIEVWKPHLENYEMAHHARPPTWVTFLSRSFLDKLGGIEALRQAVGPGDFEFLTMQHGFGIRAGAAPVLADANRGEDIAPEQKQLARVLAPLYSDRPAILFDERPDEDTLTWLRRHI